MFGLLRVTELLLVRRVGQWCAGAKQNGVTNDFVEVLLEGEVPIVDGRSDAVDVCGVVACWSR